ncbi:MAG: SDR family oxidoreductase [Luminiphilus sp.]|nr:SDR family oxidoreductase [Luminiphilus sp.]
MKSRRCHLSRRLLRMLVGVTTLSCLISGQTSLATDRIDERTSGEHTPTVLITGANRGIGLALARRFHQQGFAVIATARKPEEALELKDIGVEVLPLDITDPASVDALKSKLNGRRLDILLNNAGIGGHSTSKLKDLDIERLKHTFDVNSLGALRVTQALIPNMKIGSRRIVASMSSRMGSIEQNTGGAIGYRASKSALNSINKSLSGEFSEQDFVFVVLHPGWVRTDMTNERATYSTDESAQQLFKVITGLSKSDTGHFYDLHGKSIPW